MRGSEASRWRTQVHLSRCLAKTSAASVRSCPSRLNPTLQLRFKRCKREHAVLELHLMERAYVETLAQARFGAGAHLLPFNTPERVRQYKPGVPTDKCHRLCCPLGRTQRHRFAKGSRRLIGTPTLELHAEVRDHHRRY